MKSGAHKLVLIGFGTVGQGLAEILRDKAGWLKRQYGFEASVVAVSTATRGSLYHPDGLDIQSLLDAIQVSNSLGAHPETPGLERGWDSLRLIRESDADVMVESSWTDLETGQPATNYIQAALETGKHVVTSNKGPVALAYGQLKSEADSRGLSFGIEGTVMAGTPALRLVADGLAGCHINRLRGILNGTTNFILTEMENGASYAEALSQAQALGYAEADPTADVEGYDALAKLLILAAVVMDSPIASHQVNRQGITQINSGDVETATAVGKRWKLIAELAREGDDLKASVAPQLIPADHPLAGVSGPANAISYHTDLLGEVTLVGPGAGRQETGYALLADLLAI